VLPLAVHFCSLECKDKYLAELSDKPASLLEIESVTAEPATGRRITRARKKPVREATLKRATSRKTRRS
jgi:hypothetical protein